MPLDSPYGVDLSGESPPSESDESSASSASCVGFFCISGATAAAAELATAAFALAFTALASAMLARTRASTAVARTSSDTVDVGAGGGDDGGESCGVNSIGGGATGGEWAFLNSARAVQACKDGSSATTAADISATAARSTLMDKPALASWRLVSVP